MSADHHHDRGHHDHHHDDPAGDLREEDHPLWRRDHISLASVGIDIGSATAQSVFSRLSLRRMGRDLSSRYAVTARETWHRSPVRLTPFRDDVIDSAALEAMVDKDYQAAGVSPDEIDTGVVILTGEAAARRNARVIGDLLAARGGHFVSVAAGHHLEGALAAHGCGAVALSRTAGNRVLTIDIGGGTTKLVLVDAGAVVATAALHVGGRLVAFDCDGAISRAERAGQRWAAACGFRWRVGDYVGADEVARVATTMAETVLAAARGEPIHHAWLTDGGRASPWLTLPLNATGVDTIMFSGGVAEYVDGEAPAFCGDLGHAIGVALRERLGTLPAPVAPASARIRATVAGAAEYTVQVSGNTIYTSPASALPMRNVRVARPRLDLANRVDPDAVAAAITAHLTALGAFEADDVVALALDWTGDPSYQRLAALADGVCQAFAARIAGGQPLCLVFDHDVAELVGARVAERTRDVPGRGPVVVVDGIRLADLDFIDIGAVLPDSGAAPVTVKSLLFSL